MVRIDPYKIKEKYLNWKRKTESGIPELTKFNSYLIKQYDLETT